MRKYSLGELAHLDRCLFPGDFREELQELGVDSDICLFLYTTLRNSKGEMGILDLYQEYISDPETVAVIEQYVEWFVSKMRSRPTPSTEE